MEKVKRFKNKITSHPDWQIFVISLFFGIIVSFGKIAADDAVIYGNVGASLRDWVKWAIDQYYTWSSRQLVNFVWAVVLRSGRIVWFLYMSVSMFVMLKALKLLFGDSNKRVELYAIAIMMLFPFGVLSTAGWIATTVSYFGPQAFAVMSLVPIKKIFKGESMKSWQFLLFCLCLLYGANAEQMCVVLLGCYGVASIYLIIREKKYDWRMGVLTVLTISSLVYTMTCPGNWTRDDSETAYWFPTYGMLDTIDKADIGLSTTLRWMFLGGQTFIILTCIMMTCAIWKKYKEPLFRFISLIPSGAVLALGIFPGILSSIFPYLGYAVADVNYYGEFTADVSQMWKGMIHFMMLLAIVACICVEIFLLNDTVDGIVLDMTLAVMAVASRAMMGFSPTVYASNERTYTSLIFCMVVLSVHVYSQNIACESPEGETSTSIRNIEKYILWGLIVIGFLHLMYRVATALY